MARIPTGTVKQYRKQRMQVQELEVGGLDLGLLLGRVNVRDFGGIPNSNTVDNAEAIYTALDEAEATGKTAYFDATYATGERIDIPNGVAVLAKRNAFLTPTVGSGVTDAFRLLSGIHAGLCDLPGISGFSGVAVDIRSSFTKITTPYISLCGTALRWNTAEGHVVSSVAEFGTITDCDQGIEFVCGGGGGANVLEGCGVREGHFLTRTSNGILFSGGAGVYDGQFVIVDSMDFQDTVAGGFVLANTTGAAVPRFTLRVPSWFGGDGFDNELTPTKFFDAGTWINSEIDLVNARPFDQTNIATKRAYATGWKFRQIYPISDAFELAATLAEFNEGVMLHATTFDISITLAEDLVPDGTLLRFFWHVLADAVYPSWQIWPIQGSAGVMLDLIRDDDETNAGRVAVQVRNVSASNIASGSILRFKVKRD